VHLRLAQAVDVLVQGRGLAYLEDLQLSHLEEFRKSWKDAPMSRHKKQQRVTAFFRYCLAHGWITRNPAAGLSKVTFTTKPTLPFNREEYEKILNAIPLMYQEGPWRLRSEATEGLRLRLRAFILLLRWSGMRISDVVTLERSRLRPDNYLVLYMTKTGEPVQVPLPKECATILRALPSSNPKYFFWSGASTMEAAAGDWRRLLSAVFKKAAIGKRCHPHMFRDTFAVEYLIAGMPLETVSMLLGHSSIKITERHYSPWVAARQRKLENSVKEAWAQMAASEAAESTLIQ
jgi:integrase/recombinase XerD